jgi:hypothetical protein
LRLLAEVAILPGVGRLEEALRLRLRGGLLVGGDLAADQLLADVRCARASHYDPRFVAPVVTIVAAIVTAIWGSRTLAGYRDA